MEILKGLRLKAGNIILRRKVSQRKRKISYTNFEVTKNIGIIWDADNPEDFKKLSLFHQKMHERGIDVKILGYFPGNNLPDSCTAVRYLTCLKRKDVDLFFRPVSEDSNDFIKFPFDILIDINFKKSFPLYFITSMSAAGIKVGIFDPDTERTPLDLMLELKNPVDIDAFLRYAIEYLEMIKNGPEIKNN
jgi:hypothetical protein